MQTLRTAGRRMLAVVVLLGLLVPTSTQAAPTYRASERQFLQLMNASRRAHGRPALAASPAAAEVAREWSKRMAADHRLRHNPKVSEQLTIAWQRWGENVGWATNASGGALTAVARRLHRSFMESDGHRHNILGHYDKVGVGVALDDDGTMWATMVFVDRPGTSQAGRRRLRRTAPARVLADIGHSPRRAVHRAEMGAVLARVLNSDGPETPTQHFDDVGSNPGAFVVGALDV
jgi:hypothetical protein